MTNADNQRVVSPPLSEMTRLRTPLMPGEEAFLEFLLKHLSQDWEIYVQPHLNGLRPDFVLLNPRIGLAVFEVKDWRLGADRRVRRCNPVDTIHHYKDEIHQLYCPRSASQTGVALITAGLVFPFEDTARLHTEYDATRLAYGMLNAPRYYPLVGSDLLASGNIGEVFPEATRTSSYLMSADTSADLRNWLVEPEVSAEQRRPLGFLNPEQKRLATSRTDTGFRKIRGPAGSGKSLVLAARAAQLAAEDKDVLVVTFNITMLNYLMDLAVRCPNNAGRTREQVTWLNFHYWCKRVCLEGGAKSQYDALWHGCHRDEGTESKDDPVLSKVLSRELPSLTSSVLSSEGGNRVATYDAILVDEGQDFRLEWWNCLRKALRPGGEMVLVADRTQDIYGVSQYWTEEKMVGSGLVGAWAQLPWSYRLPNQVVTLAARFAEDYLPPKDRDLPVSPPAQGDLLAKLRWVQVRAEDAAAIIAREMMNLAPSADPEHLAMADITLLAADQDTGIAVAQELNELNVQLEHTFAALGSEGRRRKLAFFKGDARLKATTLHSFKGWESRSLVLYTGDQ
ncbi:MAG: nuclease-related domain-containing protein, partial [Actinomycetota bacterium]